MRAYDNNTSELSFSYNCGRGFFRVRVNRFLFPAEHYGSRRELCTLRDFRKLLDVLELADDGPEVAAFPFYYFLKLYINNARARRDRITPRGSADNKKIDAITKNIASAVKLSSQLQKYGYPVLTDGDPEKFVRDWIQETRPSYYVSIADMNRTLTWSALGSLVSDAPRGAGFAVVARYTGLCGVTMGERDIIFAIIAELENRGLCQAA